MAVFVLLFTPSQSASVLLDSLDPAVKSMLMNVQANPATMVALVWISPKVIDVNVLLDTLVYNVMKKTAIVISHHVQAEQCAGMNQD